MQPTDQMSTSEADQHDHDQQQVRRMHNSRASLVGS